jgi:DNA-binding beta-propeller fold protein YncE
MFNIRLLRTTGRVVTMAICISFLGTPGLADLMIVGGDNKVMFDGPDTIFEAPGSDVVSVVDIGTDPANPRIIANLLLSNSVFGPPTNLVVTPDESLALVTKAMNWVQTENGWKPEPDNRIHVIDLTQNPPALIDTVTVDRQPSGMAISRSGRLALVAHRKSGTIGVLEIKGKTVTMVQSLDLGEEVASVAITPDGGRALVTKFSSHKIAVLEIANGLVSYDAALDMPVGLRPYNVQITPDGTLGLTADHGSGSDGHIDTVSVIDLTLTPPRVIDRVMVGDAPEGLAISPTGKIAVAVLLKGSAGIASDSWVYNRNGSVVVLTIDGKSVRRTSEVDVRGLPEGVVFTPDGRYLYVGNFADRDISVLKVEGSSVTNTGVLLKLPANPASMRSRMP